MQITPEILKRKAAALAGQSFKFFCEYFWKEVSVYPLVWGRHLDALCQHLQAVKDQKIDKLLVIFPPRHGKSTIVAELFPVWYQLHNPAAQIIQATHSVRLSRDHAGLSRRLISSQRFQDLYPGEITLDEKKNAEDYYKTLQGGQRLSLSVGSKSAGFDASLLIIDDLIDIEEADSEVKTESAVSFFRGIQSREVPTAGCPLIVIGHRVHEADVAGEILKSPDGWTVLCLPAEYRGPLPYPNQLGYADPRTEIGEVLWPEGMPKEKLAQKKMIHLDRYQCLYNADVTPSEGNLFDSATLKQRYEVHGSNYVLGGRVVDMKDCFRFSVCDPAISERKTADFTAILTCDVTPHGDICFVDLFRDRIDGTKLIPTLEGIYRTHDVDFIAIEDVAFQRVLCDMMHSQNFTVYNLKADKDKVARTITARIRASAGRLWFPSGQAWVNDAVSQLTTFPRASHDDIVDVVSYSAILAAKYGNEPEPASLTEEQAKEKETRAAQEHHKSLLFADLPYDISTATTTR